MPSSHYSLIILVEVINVLETIRRVLGEFLINLVVGAGIMAIIGVIVGCLLAISDALH